MDLGAQFEFEHRSVDNRIEGWALDPKRGEVVAHTIIRPGHTTLYDTEATGIESFEEPSGQMAFPITHSQPKVAWASATRAGRAAAAPHVLLAAMAHEYGVVPVADETLSPEGAAMARSAAKRGLIQPHPANPEMEATADPMEYGSPSEIDRSLRRSHLSSYQGAHMEGSFGRPSVFNRQQMSLARQRVLPPRRKPPEEHEQGTLF